ncbi:unnamed protein product, partial [Rotaria sp. Silwood1]
MSNKDNVSAVETLVELNTKLTRE